MMLCTIKMSTFSLYVKLCNLLNMVKKWSIKFLFAETLTNNQGKLGNLFHEIEWAP